ncbi:MAG: CoA transferase [Gemmatimonadetes bacterium]|jgi:crotonobetainyl-CoA:carnitine CoA-transferase CaiB-like acyl-CoA transferase|nr:CoA transferase [Gemmatimonadota bacterium]MBT7863701.1 CoA transferase [Gemmatimonadota bacterium]
MAHPPLRGVRILAIEQFGAGPWATMALADLGAEIIKIENPLTGGDVARYVTPYTVDQDSVYFQSFNRNKKSITLNLQHPDAAAVLHPLAAASDAVFNNLRGDLPQKLGLDYPALKHLKEALVCCSLSAFGRQTPRAAEPGYDYMMQGYAGWMSITGEPGGPPQKSGLSLVDLNGGICAALGMVSAILRARETGVGCDVDVNLFDTALSQLGYVGAWHLTKGYQPERTPDSSHPSQIPSQVLPTQDGWLVVMCAKEKFYRNLVRIIGAPELAEDPRFDSFENRLAHRDELVIQLKAITQQKPTAEWLRLLKGEVPCAPVNSVEEALADPQVIEDQMIIDLPHPEFGTVRTVAGPIKISDADVEHRRGPKLGEHTDEILQTLLDLPPETIAGYRQDGLL